jgi:hypothetical protein
MCLNISGSRSDGSTLLGGGTGVNKRPGTLQAELLVTQFWNPFNIAKKKKKYGAGSLQITPTKGRVTGGANVSNLLKR